MNTTNDTTRYIAAVVIRGKRGLETKYICSNNERVNPILSDDRKQATEFVSASDANSNGNQAIREYAERGDFQQRQAKVHVLPAKLMDTIKL